VVARHEELRVSVHSCSEWGKLSALWEELANASNGSVFLSVPWVGTWLEQFEDELKPSVVVFSSLQEVVGACLLVRKKTGLPGLRAKTVFLNASGEPARDTTYIEHNALIARPGSEIAVASGLARHLGHDSDRLSLPGFTTGPGYAALVAAFPDFSVKETVRPSCYVDLADIRRRGIHYQMALKQKQRSKLRQRIRYYESLGPIHLQAARDVEAALAMYERMAELSRRRWSGRTRPSSFCSPRFTQFNRRFIQNWFAADLVQLLEVKAGAETVGILQILVHRGKVYFYQCGFDYRSGNRLSPGHVSIAKAIEYCLEAGFNEFDLLAGQGRYKEDLSTQSRNLVWAVFERPRLSLRVEQGLREIASRALANWLIRARRVPPNVYEGSAAHQQ
jgi:CelD/BcsL family acetyltransferase involved in cellulose biosynthesis